jgi:multiple sugar transport system permease protein
MAIVRPAPEHIQQPKRQILPRRVRDWFWGYFFIIPSFAMFVIFSLYPMYDTVRLSFEKLSIRGGVQTRTWVGFDNYEYLLNDVNFRQAMINTGLYALWIVPFGVFLSLSLALLIYRLPTFWQVFYKSAFYLPVVTSGVVLSFVWLYLYDPAFGLLNYVLGVLGIAPRLWLSDLDTSMLSLVIMFHATHWGGSIILLTASMGGIPKDLYEAARLDGASFLKQSTSITIPLLKPAITYVAITASIASLQIFTEILLMTRGGPDGRTANMVFAVYQQGFINFNFGRASAVAVMLLIITIVVAVAQFRLLRSNVEY